MSKEPVEESEIPADEPVSSETDSASGDRDSGGHSADEAFKDESMLQAEETRDDEMERLRRTAEEADKRVLQAQAEAENFRKRMRRDFEDQIKFASTDLIVDLLQVRDNLLRAIEAASASESRDGLLEGVEMVTKQMDDVFSKHAVVEIPAEGETFDPNLHEAISQIPSEHASGQIAHVAVSGFKLHDRVIRPSQVVVSTGPQ